MAKTIKKHMSKEEIECWNELYQYVKINVLRYDENQSLSNSMVLRLKGLLTNKFIANNNIEDAANYSHKVVLNTFKFCMPKIEQALKIKTFSDENHKFNYILKIVENNLNNVYMKMKNAEKAEEKIETMEMNVLTHEGAEYKAKTKTEKTNMKDKFADMW